MLSLNDDSMGRLNRRIVTTRHQRLLYSALGFPVGILMLAGAYYYFPMGHGFFHNRFVFRLGGIGIFIAGISVWGFVRNLIPK
jgi:hypothetical protein